MVDLSAQMLIFVTVIEQGSISAAARVMGQTPSAVSKQIAFLEDHVHHRLLHRTPKGVSATDEGHAFLEKCKELSRAYQDAESFIANFDGKPRGTLKVVSSVAFGKSQIIPILPQFLKMNPSLRVALELTDRKVDIEQEDFDVAIQFAEQSLGSNLIVRKIMENERVFCAAPAYLEQHGWPGSFEDLVAHNCLLTSGRDARNAWVVRENGQKVTLDVSGNFQGNSADVVYRATLAGLGIARLSTYLVAGALERAELVRIFPDYAQEHADIAVVFADKRNLAAKVRVFVDFLAEHFRKHVAAA